MAELIRIGGRILNLDQLLYARSTGEGENRTVVLMFERRSKIDLLPGQSGYQVQRKSGSLNISFQGEYADVVWKKLIEISDEWPTPIDATWPEEDEEWGG